MKRIAKKIRNLSVLDKALIGSLGLVTTTAVILPMSFYMHLASLSLCLLSFGVLLRKNTRTHLGLMLSGVVLDLSLVLTLESNRGAIDTVASMELSALQMTHVGLALLAVLTYLPTLILGFLNLKKRSHQLNIHRLLGKLAFTLRFLSWIFMLSFLEK